MFAENTFSMMLAANYFSRMHALSQDPWGLRTRWHESRKRRITRAALPRRHYDAAFELGCSVGELGATLAPLCDSYLAWDRSRVARKAAARRLAHFAHARVECADARRRWPDATFDLIILSEIGYYFDEAELANIVARCRASLRSSGTLLGCHWRHRVDHCPLSGDRVQAIIGEVAGLRPWLRHVEDDFRLDVWCDADKSVACDEGPL